MSPMMGNWNENWGLGEWLIMVIAMVLFWGLAVGIVVSVMRRVRGRSGQSPSPTSAGWDELLAERFARGEINDEEFQRGRELLHGRTGPK